MKLIIHLWLICYVQIFFFDVFPLPKCGFFGSLGLFFIVVDDSPACIC